MPAQNYSQFEPFVPLHEIQRPENPTLKVIKHVKCDILISDYYYEYAYLGCLEESYESSYLDLAECQTSLDMTHEVCFEMCKSYENRYASLAEGNTCCCSGSDYYNTKLSSDASDSDYYNSSISPDCDSRGSHPYPCEGNAAQICGRDDGIDFFDLMSVTIEVHGE